MGNRTVSIVVPVYRVESYLDKCVVSLLNQTYSDIEIILVDDGSDDRSGAICNEFALKDKRVKTVHKTNGGLSDARNIGVKLAVGEFIAFIDSDDYWQNRGMIKHLIEVVSDTSADVVNFGFESITETDGRIVKSWTPYTDKQHVLKLNALELTKNSGYRSSACMKFIKSEIVKEIDPFEKGRLSEDIIWSANVLAHADRFANIDEKFYRHLVRSGSITTTLGQKSCVDLVHAIEGSVRIGTGAVGEKQIAILRYAAYQLGTFVIVQAVAEKCPSDCYHAASKYVWLLKYHANDKKVTYLYWLVRVLGFHNTCRLVRFLKQNARNR